MRSALSVGVSLLLAPSVQAGDPPTVVIPKGAIGEHGRFAGIADANLDGLLDAVSVAIDGIGFHQGTGFANLAPRITSLLPPDDNHPSGAVADLDLDGDVDVVSVGELDIPFGWRLYVSLGAGDGTFHLDGTYDSPGGTRTLTPVAADLDDDGLPDVLSGKAYFSVLTYRGLGGGALGLPEATPVDDVDSGFGVADLDSDGDIDVVARCPSTDASANVRFLANDGMGQLTVAPKLFSYGFANLNDTDVGDANHDGLADLAVAASSGLDLILGSGLGLLMQHTGSELYPGQEFWDVGIGDVDLDGHADLRGIWEENFGDPAVAFVIRSDGAGGWLPLEPLAAPGLLPSLVADFDADGVPDLIGGGGEVVVVRGEGGGAFAATPELPGPPSSTNLRAADFDGDGQQDVIATAEVGLSLDVLLGDGLGGLGAPLHASASGGATISFTGLECADLDGDGDMDAVTTSGFTFTTSSDNLARAWINSGSGQMVPNTLFAAVNGTASALESAACDIDGDGDLDLVFATNGVSVSSAGMLVSLGDGSGAFAAPVPQQLGHDGRYLGVADFDADGDPDAVASWVNVVHAYRNDSGAFAATVTTPLPDGPEIEGPGDLVVLRLDGDALPDVAVVSDTDVFPLVGQGALAFAVGAPIGDQDDNWSRPITADLDDDGLDDVVTGFYGICELLEADGNGGLVQRARTGVRRGHSAAALQLDGDAPLEVLCGTSEAFFTLLDQPPWPTWGQQPGGIPGVDGVPLLKGLGTLQGATPMALRIVNAAPVAPTTLVIGLGELSHPFKGGVLFPTTDLLVALATDIDGDALLASLWPAGLPSGLHVNFQAWIVDASGPYGLAATPGLMATTP